MDEAPIKGLLDILPAYMNFVIGFLRSPRAAFAPYALTGRVQSDLNVVYARGVGAAYLAGVLMPIPGFDNPESARRDGCVRRVADASRSESAAPRGRSWWC